MNDIHANYIAGAWDVPDGPLIPVENPATGEIIGEIPASTAADVDRAVAAAGDAFASWSQTTAADRADLIRALVQGLERRADDIAHTISTDVGSPIRIAKPIQTQLPISILNSYADLLADDREERIGNSMVLREPVGVVAAVTPWNYPLQQIACKIGPALAAGATVVLKPSEVAPLVSTLLFVAAHEAGIPAGVLNLVHGRGAEVGEPLIQHDGVDMVSFTGSAHVGTRVASLAARTVKRVALELGGKSANVILNDANIQTPVKVGVSNAFLNAGQTCTAWTRLLVPAEHEEEILALAKKAAENFVPGDPLDPATRLGPLVSRAQMERVLNYIRVGLDEGAHLVTGGLEPPQGLSGGYFVRPTILGNVHPDSSVAQEEIFGPVLSVMAYTSEAQALEIANNSRFGLHGAVWSADVSRAVAFARLIRTGSVDINGGAYNPLAPFGGYKQSGIGRELGRYGLEEYQQLKSIQL